MECTFLKVGAQKLCTLKPTKNQNIAKCIAFWLKIVKLNLPLSAAKAHMQNIKFVFRFEHRGLD